MNFLEAVKSGKPFKRKDDDRLADDWIIKEDELLPCPFCGGRVELHDSKTSMNMFEVKCCSFEKCIIDRSAPFDDKDILIKTWNTRKSAK
jgi:hypothetical protein